MIKYVAILRGINVSGQKKINMNDLKLLLAKAGFGDVKTYIQSGNVLFESAEMDVDGLRKKMEQTIFDAYDFEVPIIIRTVLELKEVVKNNPFFGQNDVETNMPYVTFLNEKPIQTNIDKIIPAQFLPDTFVISGKEIYIVCPNGYGNTKLSNVFFENKLKLTATTRNWKTVNELVRLSDLKSFEQQFLM